MTLGRNEQKNPPVTFCYRTHFSFYFVPKPIRKKPSKTAVFDQKPLTQVCDLLILGGQKSPLAPMR